MDYASGDTHHLGGFYNGPGCAPRRIIGNSCLHDGAGAAVLKINDNPGNGPECRPFCNAVDFTVQHGGWQKHHVSPRRILHGDSAMTAYGDTEVEEFAAKIAGASPISMISATQERFCLRAQTRRPSSLSGRLDRRSGTNWYDNAIPGQRSTGGRNGEDLRGRGIETLPVDPEIMT